MNVVNGYATKVGAGTVSWTRELDVHWIEGENFHYLNINVSEEQLRLLAMSIGREKEFEALRKQKTTPFVQLGKRAAHVETEWMRLFHTQLGPAAGLLADQLAMGVLVDLITPGLQQDDAEHDAPDWLQRGLQHIDSYLEDGVTVSELSEVCGKSQEHVSRSFARYLGMSPSAWINQQRLSRAALLLSSTNREILDICFSVGFQSASYFYRLFRKEYDMAPLQYRRKYQMHH